MTDREMATIVLPMQVAKTLLAELNKAAGEARGEEQLPLTLDDTPPKQSLAAKRRAKVVKPEAEAEDGAVWVAGIVGNAGTAGDLDPLVSLTAFAVSRGFDSLRDVPADEREEFAAAYRTTIDATEERPSPGTAEAEASATPSSLDDW